MGANSNIEWCDATFNPWRGCTKVSDGCKHCYAETLSNRFDGKHGVWGPKGTRVVASESMWKQPEKWNREAGKAVFAYLTHIEAYEEGLHETKPVKPRRPRVFCASLADVFEGPDTMPKEAWDAVEDARGRLYELIEATPNLDWLILTKRPENVLKYGPLGMRWAQDPMPANVWIGTSVEDQATADERIPHLLRCPAAVRFLSCEPLLGPVQLIPEGRDIGNWWMENLHWVICGGESGPNARPMHPDWARSLRDQCQAAGVPFFFKQWGEWRPMEDSDHDSTMVKGWPDALGNLEPRDKWVARVGKHKAGRLLDGRTWDEFPEVLC